MNNILIVEDEDFLIMALKDNLVAEGYTVDIARNGDEALKKIQKKKPSLVLLDILMPQKDGFYVLEEIKKNPERQLIPVIVLSNLGEDKVIKRALDMGADDYLVKSQHSIQEVIKRVKDYLEGVKTIKGHPQQPAQ
ncbi:hypothetical protein A3H03_00990 [Candidatus Kuenenbacteria bacterium RIFCSPLOWO2_12_FULL_42_13]|uniref:Response regulatory domain-containing protein n=1 Tax=Candidatus Kuenenbacteria bacterium RIFCSPLOWO2_12_FULL_42_13 TaxID=1798565 RepID=A0A1F6G350_9BACT|nr:MAG: hypothetical protein A3H03_00990 [Candidatus Kuenenbacteria bacterium RIFCSPLOWO2_12_FULL_42_13]